MANNSVEERIAVLENEIEHAKKTTAIRTKQMAEVDEKLDTLLLEFSRYRGFVGGILLVVTAIVTFVKLFGADVTAFFSK